MGNSRLIGELAAQVGMARSALRYYEEAGLLTPAERTAAGYRIYGPGAVARIRFIQRASALGLKLTEIRRLIESSHGAGDERSLLQAVISRKIEETRTKMGELSSRAAELLSVERRLQVQTLPDNCHLGDCTCWFSDAC